MEGWDWAPASVIYGTVVGGFTFGFVQFVAKAFMRSGETRPPNIAGTPSSLIAIRGADWIKAAWNSAPLSSDRQTSSKNCSLNRNVECPSVGTILAYSFSDRSAMAVRLPLPRKEAPSPTNRYVGSRVRVRRIMLAMSQEQLAEALGIAYQQVQKYEKGANRIAASRLQQISHILQVPLTFFFEGAPNALAPYDSSGSALSMAQIDDFISDSDGLRLIGAFIRIRSEEHTSELQSLRHI